MIILSVPPLYEPGWSPWTGTFEIEWPSEESVRSANHLRIFIAHGKSDPMIDIKQAHKSIDLYRKSGYDVTLFEFEGGHQINAAALKKIEKWINK